MRGWVVLVALASLLAGCSDDKSPPADDPTDGHDDHDGHDGHDDNETTPPIQVVVASLTADLLNGSAPLVVNFTIDATGAESVNWTVQFGDGSDNAVGDEIPATITHIFTIPGNFTVSLEVASGTVTADADVAISVVPGVDPTVATQTAPLGHSAGSTGCADSPPAAEFGTPAAGVLWTEFLVDPLTFGQVYTATFTGSNPVLVYGVLGFYGSDDALIAEEFGEGTFSGTVPEGAVHALFQDCAAGQITGTYQTAPA